MNTEHVNEWVAALRDPAYDQCNGTLARPDQVGGWSYCCLGIGERLRVGREPHEEMREEPSPTRYSLHDQVFGYTLPQPEFHDWLGIDVPDHVDEGCDVYIDWPAAGETYVGEFPLTHYRDAPGLIMSPVMSGWDEPYFQRLSCADLNDNLRLTFDQIADVIAYFGVTS